jgi:polyphosphate:AMP phosphotransferase
MFESAELGHTIDKKSYDKEVSALREALLEAQIEMAKLAKFQVIILVGGVDGAGRGETVNLLNAWMDPRYLQTHGMGDPSDEELDRPMMWRFWRELPPKGRIGIFLGSWYTQPIISRVYGQSKVAELDQSLESAKRLETMLADEGALILKFWMHLSRDKQKKRLKLLEADPKARWRVTKRDWAHFKLYDKFYVVSESVIRHTSTAEAPWTIVEGFDANYRSLTVGKTILDVIRKRLDTIGKEVPEISAPPPLPAIDNLDILKTLNLNQKISKQDYLNELERFQGKLALLTRSAKFKNITVITMFEGNDAAGKGGAIRRITGALDARYYNVIPIAAPTEEERAQPYLWRFWRHIPRRARMTIFDRSWYGRVLVERVEKFCSEADWMRAYSEINDFEAQLVRHNIIVVKFWLSISKDEQLKRFKEREAIAFKHFKLTPDDWRNRDKWDEYEQAVCDMVDRTSTKISPWTLIEANDKYFARIKVLKTLCQRIETAISTIEKT